MATANVYPQQWLPSGHRGKILTPTAVSHYALQHQLPLTRTANANAPVVVYSS